MSTNNSEQNEHDRRPNIAQWQPPTWEHFLGNRAPITFLKKLVKKIRNRAKSASLEQYRNFRILLTGPSRSGKTAMVKFFMRCLVCESFDWETLSPCNGGCAACRQDPELSGLEGVFARLHAIGPQGQTKVPVHITVIDCTLLQPDQLRERIITIGTEFDGIKVIYFDEFHRLARRGMEEMLLKAVEDKNFVWIFSTAKPEGLEDMLLNRLLKFSTQLPTPAEMEDWLAHRCNEWGIRWEPRAIMRLAEKSNLVAGTALQALELSALDDEEGLSLDLVENVWQVRLDQPDARAAV